jgi:hypothetical protein
MSKGRSVGDRCEGASVKRRNIFSATAVALSLVCVGWPVPAAADQAPAAKKTPAPKKSSDWNGRFMTDYQGEVGELTLLALGSYLGGTFVSNGEQYSIGGRIDGSRATGAVTDPSYQSLPFEALASAAGIAFTVTIRNENGVPTPVTLTFERPEAFAARRAAEEARAAKAGGAAAAAGGGSGGGARAAGDARLVGAWRATEAGRSGDFTWASDNFIRFAADGSCADGGGRTYAGSGSVSGGTGAGAITACQWSVRDRVLYMRSGGGGWQQVAKYAVHENGDVMMWTYGDGSKRIWERQ